MTTITREHLELAAKAAGKQVSSIPDKATGGLVVHHRPGRIWQPWQPHIESLDTWRLAAACKMTVYFDRSYVQVWYAGHQFLMTFGDTLGSKGRTAAEAVTLAAAEIGRAMG